MKTNNKIFYGLFSARGGSERCKRKFLRDCGDKKLFEHTTNLLLLLKKNGYIEDIFFNSDDKEYNNEIKNYSSEIKIIGRSRGLSNSKTTVGDICIDTKNRVFGKNDNSKNKYLIFIDYCRPFTNINQVIQCVYEILNNDYETVISCKNIEIINSYLAFGEEIYSLDKYNILFSGIRIYSLHALNCHYKNKPLNDKINTIYDSYKISYSKHNWLGVHEDWEIDINTEQDLHIADCLIKYKMNKND